MGCGQSIDDKVLAKPQMRSAPEDLEPTKVEAEQPPAAAGPKTPARYGGMPIQVQKLKMFQQKRSQMLQDRMSQVTSEDVYDYVNTKDTSPSEKSTSRVSALVSERIPFDPEKVDHTIIVKVLQFVCGRPHPPAPNPVLYMEDGLADKMVVYQKQMKEEITSECEGCACPISATFWELEMMHPSAEDLELRVYEIVALVVDRSGAAACMVDMNVYILGDRVSGFTLDGVSQISIEKVDEDHLAAAQAFAANWGDGMLQDVETKELESTEASLHKIDDEADACADKEQAMYEKKASENAVEVVKALEEVEAVKVVEAVQAVTVKEEVGGASEVAVRGPKMTCAELLLFGIFLSDLGLTVAPVVTPAVAPVVAPAVALAETSEAEAASA